MSSMTVKTKDLPLNSNVLGEEGILLSLLDMPRVWYSSPSLRIYGFSGNSSTMLGVASSSLAPGRLSDLAVGTAFANRTVAEVV